MKNAFIQIKDPMAKGDVVYDIPFQSILPTAGLKGKGHRSCLCRLYLEGRCGQGKKCKSYHVDRDLVARLRIERHVEMQENFITEVVVCDVIDSRLLVFAVRFPAVLRTKGLDEYKKSFSHGVITPRRLCTRFISGTCENRDCDMIHVKQTETQSLNMKRLRTPCCAQHGDRFDQLTANHEAKLVLDSGIVIVLPTNLLASNEATNRLRKGLLYKVSDICKPHITGRCKFGKSCGNLHVCRSWWKNTFETPTMRAVERQAYDTSVTSSACITPISTPPLTPSPRCDYTFVDDDDMPPLLIEESFTLPVWNPDCGIVE